MCGVHGVCASKNSAAHSAHSINSSKTESNSYTLHLINLNNCNDPPEATHTHTHSLGITLTRQLSSSLTNRKYADRRKYFEKFSEEIYNKLELNRK